MVEGDNQHPLQILREHRSEPQPVDSVVPATELTKDSWRTVVSPDTQQNSTSPFQEGRYVRSTEVPIPGMDLQLNLGGITYRKVEVDGQDKLELLMRPSPTKTNYAALEKYMGYIAEDPDPQRRVDHLHREIAEHSVHVIIDGDRISLRNSKEELFVLTCDGTGDVEIRTPPVKISGKPVEEITSTAHITHTTVSHPNNESNGVIRLKITTKIPQEQEGTLLPEEEPLIHLLHTDITVNPTQVQELLRQVKERTEVDNTVLDKIEGAITNSVVYDISEDFPDEDDSLPV
ncbi:MAG: hypothetical protein ACOCXQ_04630 [Patescibacteria group bacterium]